MVRIHSRLPKFIKNADLESSGRHFFCLRKCLDWLAITCNSLLRDVEEVKEVLNNSWLSKFNQTYSASLIQYLLWVEQNRVKNSRLFFSPMNHGCISSFTLGANLPSFQGKFSFPQTLWITLWIDCVNSVPKPVFITLLLDWSKNKHLLKIFYYQYVMQVNSNLNRLEIRWCQKWLTEKSCVDNSIFCWQKLT